MKAGTVRPKNRAAYKPNTIRSYERAVTHHLASSDVGALKVVDVQRQDVQEFADELLADGLSAGTVSNTLNPVQAFYRRALDRGQLAYNPAERIDLPAAANRRPTRIASPADAAALIAALPERTIGRCGPPRSMPVCAGASSWRFAALMWT
jgi:site-specific recombinase XerD